VVEAAELARALDRHDVARLLDDADDALVAARVGAHGTELALGEVEAAPAEADALLDLDDRLGEREDLLARLPEDVEREALRAARSDPRQPRELLDQAVD